MQHGGYSQPTRKRDTYFEVDEKEAGKGLENDTDAASATELEASLHDEKARAPAPKRARVSHDDRVVMTESAKTRSRLKCIMCSQEYSTWGNTSKHLVKVHEVTGLGDRDRSRESKIMKYTSPKFPLFKHQCKICREVVMCIGNLISAHLKKHGGMTVEEYEQKYQHRKEVCA